MKKIILTSVLLVFITACQTGDKRYTQTSTEIDSYRAALAAYETGDWESYKGHFADTAKIYHNSVDKYVSPAESAARMKESTAQFSSYGFVEDEGDAEMVVSDKGETWVNFWGTWKGTFSANEKEVTIPVHTTAMYIDGKIVKEYGYWDTAPIVEAVKEIEAASKEAAEGEETEQE
ncbi:MAG: SnoaL-like domain-containing protein [Flavobacteriaceae bacterium]|nr:SnoaL-like domain-containing protein [Flavobacteriaceae bacterium]